MLLVENEARAKGVAIHKDLDDEIETIDVDADKMKQVLLNLLFNAIELVFTGGGGWLRKHQA